MYKTGVITFKNNNKKGYNLFRAANIGIFILISVFIILLLITPVIYLNKKILTETSFFTKEFCFAISFSIFTTFISIIFSAIIAVPIGYVLARHDFKGKTIIDTLIDLLVVIPPLVLGVSLLILLGPVFGDQLLKVGIKFVFTPLGVILAQFVVSFPYIVKINRNTFQGISKEIEESAVVFGASEFEVFKYIILPLSKNGIISGICLGWARAMGEFGVTIMLAGATKFRTETLPIFIYLNISTGEIEGALYVAFIMIFLSFIILRLIKKFHFKIEY